MVIWGSVEDVRRLRVSGQRKALGLGISEWEAIPDLQPLPSLGSLNLLFLQGT